jgi:hypothetical protein
MALARDGNPHLGVEALESCALATMLVPPALQIRLEILDIARQRRGRVVFYLLLRG